MKFIKRSLLLILSFAIGCILFRGPIFRCFVTYKQIGQRPNHLPHSKNLIDYIETNADGQKNPDPEKIIKQARSLTSKQLHFSSTANETDPNILITSKAAHCVGYAAFFSTTCNYLFKKHNLAGQWVATPKIGQLYLFGVNVHLYFHGAFFKDHDFVLIENKTTGETLAVDPTVHDYLRIDFVNAP